MITFISVINMRAQNIADSKVPAAIKEAFAKNYAGVSIVKREPEDGKYEANFKKDGHEMSAVFDKNGKLVESEPANKVSGLPASVSSYAKQYYKGAASKRLQKLQKADGTIQYEAEVNHKDLIFESNGNFIKQTTETGEKREKED